MESATGRGRFQSIAAAAAESAKEIGVALGLFCCPLIIGIPAAEVPEVKGVVLTMEDQAAIQGAAIVIAIEGKSLLSELPMFEGATHRSGRRCVARMITESDAAGAFNWSSFRIMAHVGAAEFRIVPIKVGYRSKVDGQRIVANQSEQVTLTMWPDIDALKYNALDGKSLNLERVADRAAYVEAFLSRHGFLSDLIAYSGIARRCERELSEVKRRTLLENLFREWLATAPETPKPALEQAVCNELALVKKESPSLLLSLDQSALAQICPSL